LRGGFFLLSFTPNTRKSFRHPQNPEASFFLPAKNALNTAPTEPLLQNTTAVTKFNTQAMHLKINQLIKRTQRDVEKFNSLPDNKKQSRPHKSLKKSTLNTLARILKY